MKQYSISNRDLKVYSKKLVEKIYVHTTHEMEVDSNRSIVHSTSVFYCIYFTHIYEERVVVM